MTKKIKKAMVNKLKDYVEILMSGKDIPWHNFPLASRHAAYGIYSAISRGEKPEFFSSDVKWLLDKSGIETEPCGIGWKVA